MTSSILPPPAPIDSKVNDTVLGTVVTVNEWIRNELYRLQNNVRPRQCENYDQLVSFIVDPKLLESLKPAPPVLPSLQEPTTQQRNPSTTLCRVFLEIMRYCSSVTNTNAAPRLLLSEIDKLRQDVKEQKAVHALQFRDKLSHILFGQVQMTEYLIKCWKFLCEWVTRPPLNDNNYAMKWIETTLSAFIAAKRIFLQDLTSFV